MPLRRLPVTSLVFPPPLFTRSLCPQIKPIANLLQAGDNVVICSRDEERVRAEAEALCRQYGPKRAVGIPVDVTKARGWKNP
jgi:hypothetical protein